jgi:hypothetical protein
MLTLKELGVQFRSKNNMVDNITNDAPILSAVKWSESSDVFSNKVKTLQSVTPASFVDRNEGLTEVKITTSLKSYDLQKMGAKMTISHDDALAYNGGKDAYFADSEPKILRETGKNVEKEIVNDIWKKYCLATTGKALKTAAASGQGYTLYAVRFVDNETCGLYQKGLPFNRTSLLERILLNGGNLTLNNDGLEVYGCILKGYFSFQIANEHSIACICNIQDGKLPSMAQIEDLLAEVHADNSNTILVCSPKCLSLLGGLKTASLRTSVNDQSMVPGFRDWDGVPFVTSWNLTKEDFVTIS